MLNLRKLLMMFRAYRAGAPLGDVALLKLDALFSPKTEIELQLKPLRDCAPPQELASLRALPMGSLGSGYASFLEANGIAPLVISAKMRAQFRQNLYALLHSDP